MERKEWLEIAILDYISNNPGKDSVDIVSYFKLRADITMAALGFLQSDGKMSREHIGGSRYGYFKN